MTHRGLGGLAAHRAAAQLCTEVSLSEGLLLLGVMLGCQDSHGQGLCAQAGPLCFTPCSSAPTRRFQPGVVGAAAWSQDLSLPVQMAAPWALQAERL